MKKQATLVLKGLCMGTADVIPGVSGGTMALILGIYERLVAAIRLMDLRTLRLMLVASSWRRLFTLLANPDAEKLGDRDDHHIGAAAFLLTLGTGIIAAVLTGVRVIPVLMERYPSQTAGFFFGLILASIVVPWRMMERRGLVQLLALAAVAAGTFVLVGLPTDSGRFAHGEVTLAGSAGEARTLPAATTLFVAVRDGALKDGKVSRGALTFRPTHDVVWPAGQSELTVKVVATRSGADANVAAGTISTTVEPIAGVSEVRQAAAMSGGEATALWYLFLCGAIAICAMILPGISGSFLLLLLGQYGYVLFQVHRLVYERNGDAMVAVGVFIAGIVVGILAFSRLLNWLLVNAHSTTMAALIGLMVGSLRKVWPFQITTPEGTENVLPAGFDGVVGATALACAVGIAIVATMTIVGARKAAARPAAA
ncbi:MAG: hypothetical protein AMXMBFR64_31890 [Myxococcales bacterium]